VLSVDLSISWDASIHLSGQWRGSKANLKVNGCSRDEARMGYGSIKMFLKIGDTTWTLYSKEDNNTNCYLRHISTNRFFAGLDLDSSPANAISNELIITDGNPTSTLFDGLGLDFTGNEAPPVADEIAGLTHTTFSTTINVQKENTIALWVEMRSEGEYNEATLLSSNVGYMGHAVFWDEDRALIPNKSFFNLGLESITPASTAKSCLIHEAGESITQIITGKANRLRSSILGRTDTNPAYPVDGCASLNVVTSGFLIRKFEEDKRPITTTLADYISSLQAIYNVGMALEKDGLDDVVRIEEVEYFYNDNEMIQLDRPFNYKESVAKELIYNTVKVGYNNFLDEGINLLDEFNTEHTYTTPIKKNKQEKTILSTYTAGGYTIETQRRKQFDNSPTDSAENDDNIFIINVVRDGLSNFKSLTNEGFSSIIGVFSPTTTYNIKISPKRVLYRWARWLKGAFKYKNQTSNYIRFAFGFQNKDLETVTALGCEQPGTVVETGNIQLDAFPNANAGIFSPEWIEFNHVLTWDQFETLRKKLRGQGGGTDNYGYISVLSPITGLLVQVWPYQMDYKISTQDCRFKTLKKGY